MRRIALLFTCALTLVTASQCTAQIFHKKKPVDKSTDASNTVEPDKLLYDKATNDIKHGRHEVGRLGLQTLINTYPDSEYLAKAKLAIADSYYKEGGSSNITLAINGYKDFIVFFPFLPEAAYAQMQVAMCNYNEMPKADRDTSHTKAAEEEFQTFLLKYPKDPLVPQAEQRLREVQEVLAEGQFRVAYYYYLKGDRRAAAGRLIPLVRRYPLYSKSDSALWMLGDIFEKSERKDLAGSYYAQIVKNYPLSSHDALAKQKLKDFGMPVPQPDPKALAWMTAEQNAPRPKEHVLHRSVGMLHSSPDVHTAALHGSPNLEPDSDEGGGDILKGGNRSSLAMSGGSSTGGGTSSSGSSTGAVVDVVRPGDPAPTASTDASGTDSATSSDANADNATAPSASADGSTPNSGQDSSPSAGDASKADNTQSANSDSNQKQKESSSKKKGVRKVLPW